MYSLLKNTQWENILSYGKDIDESINILYSTMLDIFSKTIPMSKLSTNAHKYPKYIHFVQSKCLEILKIEINQLLIIPNGETHNHFYILIFKIMSCRESIRL